MKKIILLIVLVILVGGSGFYGGMKYTQDKAFSKMKSSLPENLQNLSPEQRQQFMNWGGKESLIRGFKAQEGSVLLNGAVIARDDESITIKMRDGGSKIVFFSDSTEIRRFVNGSINDVEIGMQISVGAEENSDGSYTAKTIQVGSK